MEHWNFQVFSFILFFDLSDSGGGWPKVKIKERDQERSSTTHFKSWDCMENALMTLVGQSQSFEKLVCSTACTTKLNWFIKAVVLQWISTKRQRAAGCKYVQSLGRQLN